MLATRIQILALFCAALAGCAQPQPVQLRTQFDPAEHDSYRQLGTNSLTGQGFLRQKGGGTVTCAGSQVLMFPATSFFREAMDIARSGGRPTLPTTLDPAYKPILKQSQCDAAGNFEFQGLPAGRWFLMTEVTWEVADVSQGGPLMREIEVRDGEPQRVLLTDDDRVD